MTAEEPPGDRKWPPNNNQIHQMTTKQQQSTITACCSNTTEHKSRICATPFSDWVGKWPETKKKTRMKNIKKTAKKKRMANIGYSTSFFCPNRCWKYRGCKTAKKCGWCSGCRTVKKTNCFLILPFCVALPTQGHCEAQCDPPQRTHFRSGLPLLRSRCDCCWGKKPRAILTWCCFALACRSVLILVANDVKASTSSSWAVANTSKSSPLLSSTSISPVIWSSSSLTAPPKIMLLYLPVSEIA